MSDVHHPRCPGSRADRGMDHALHRQTVRRSGADDRRRPAAVDEGRAADGVEQDFIAAVGKARKFARGPKPGRALREIGLEPQVTTEKPTSEGIAEMLSRVDLKGHRVGLQLYPDRDHGALIGAIEAQGAKVDTVLPYVYDAQAADTNIVTAIEEMAQGRVDAIALTSSGQVRRLIEVARAHRMRGSPARRAGAHADRVGWTGGFGRVEIPRPAHGYLSRQRRLLHEAADIGDVDRAEQVRAARRTGIEVTIRPPVSVRSGTPDRPA